MRRAPFVRSFAYTECPLTGETEIEKEANGGMCGGLGRGGGAGTEIERKGRRMNEPQCFFVFFFPSGGGEGVKRKRAEGRDTSATLAVGVMVMMEASEGQWCH